MKETLLFALCAILAVSTATGLVINFEGQDTPHLLGTKACTWGPSYWCTNITTSSGCSATKHCIVNVWEKMTAKEDNDSVCDICKNMVKQARDQLESNQTQQDLKAVFEGSCDLILVKPIIKECYKIVDQFVPDLVETLASQMNPSVVCSVAGLCNSPHFDKLLEQYGSQSPIQKLEPTVSLEKDEYEPNECTKCYTIVHHMEYKFEHASRDNVVDRLLNICGQFSSFSDACSSLVLKYFESIYSHLQNNLNAQNVCHLSGQCSDRFHVHEDEDVTDKTLEVEIRPLSSVGMVDIGDDLPCKLCEQLVLHLRDLLVSNTTESEFQEVLEGLCKQTKSFAPECRSIVDEYYTVIYNYLTKNLNGSAICEMGGLCPAPGKEVKPIWPLIPESHAEIATSIMNEKDSEPKAIEAGDMQLPIERMSLSLGGLSIIDDNFCSSCEFVMYYIKQNVRDLSNRNEVQVVLGEMKHYLPSIKGQLEGENFLSKYELAIAELIIQKKDLSEICPSIAVCPTEAQVDAWKRIPSEFVEKSSVEDKPNCPLCLFAVSKLYDIIKENKTEESIKAALDKICHKLPKSLNQQCVDLVNIYSEELVQKILDDMSPQEICAELKLCDPAKNQKSKLFVGQKIVAVPQNNVEGKQVCALCEYVLHYIQEAITNPRTERQVKQVIGEVCEELPESVRNDCYQFVDTYGDTLVAILTQEIDPSVVCPKVHLCPSAALLESWKKDTSKPVVNKHEVEDKPSCPLCLFGITQLYNAIKDNKTKASIEAALEKLCVHLPKSLVDQCDTLVDKYSEKIVEMVLADLTPQEVCVYLTLCDPTRNVQPPISFFPLDKDGEILTNEIPEYTVINQKPEKPEKVELDEAVNEDAECEVCEFLMRYIEQAIGTKKSKDEIEHMFHDICNHLPHRMTPKCNNFVDLYGEIVIELLTQEVTPKQICTIIELCKPDTTQIQESVAECALCQGISSSIDKHLGNQKTVKEIKDVVNRACEYLSSADQTRCAIIMKINADRIFNIIKEDGNTRKICSKLSLCSANDFQVMLNRYGRIRRQADDKNLGTKPCTWGISYWCVNVVTAEECKATELCKKKGHFSEATSSTTVKATSDNLKEVSSTTVKITTDELPEFVSTTTIITPELEGKPEAVTENTPAST